MVTIYDIAKRIGCASSTVSKALNNSKEVSEKRKREILEVAKEMGYIPNSSARKLASRTSYTIGILFSENLNIGLEHHFFSGVIQAFKNEVEDAGFEVSFVSSKVGLQNLTYTEWCKYKNVDGVLIVTVDVNDVNLQELIASKFPLVSVDNPFLNVPTVITDNYTGSKQAVEYFLDQGLKRIVHIAGPQTSYAGIQRKEAYIDVMEEHGISIKPEFIEIAEYYDYMSGYNSCLNLLERNEELPEAIFASSDDIALGAIKALATQGYKVPRDIQIIGFDDIELARFAFPALSTIKQDKVMIGKKAAVKLLSIIKQEACEDCHEIEFVPAELVIRESTK